MSFFLLGKGPEGDLFLLSDTVCATRKEALAELSRRTAEDGFDHWDAEVLVMDLEKGTPVLLVRPAEPAAPQAEAESGTADEPETGTAEEPEAGAAEIEPGPEVEPLPEPEAAEAEAEEPSGEPEAAEPAEEPESAEELPGAPSGDDEAIAQAISALEDDTESVVVEQDEEVVVGADTELVDEPAAAVEETIAEAVLADLEATESTGDKLKEALRRTAASMEAEGIVAPESIGPAEQRDMVEAQDAAAEETSESQSDGQGDYAAPATGPAWPWDTPNAAPPGPIHEPGFEVHALEEPSYDDAPLVRAAGDDDTMAASRPVILGAYDEPSAPPVEPDSEGEPASAEPELVPEETVAVEEPEALPEPAEESVSAEPVAGEEPFAAEEPETVPEPADEPQTATPEEVDEAIEQLLDRAVENIEIPEVAEVASAAEMPFEPEPTSQPAAPESDYIIDVPAPPASAVPEGGYTPSGEALPMTCDDCVYVETCPHKDQRDPRTCGSFQWK